MMTRPHFRGIRNGLLRAAALAVLVAAGCSGDGAVDDEIVAGTPSDETTIPAESRTLESASSSLTFNGAAGAAVTYYVDGSIALERDAKSGGLGVRIDRATGASQVMDPAGSIVRNDLPLTGPDAQAYFPTLSAELAFDAAAAANAELSAGRARIVDDGGRQTAEVTGLLVPLGEGPETASTVTIRVDVETGLLRSLVIVDAAGNRSEVSASAPDIADRSPTIGDPVSTDVTPTKVKYAVLTPGAETGLPYRPLSPALPAGYAKSFVQVALGATGATVGRGPDPSGEQSNPESKDVYIAAFRNGYREVVVTMRDAHPSDGAATAWGDPYDRFAELTVEKYTARAGAARGSEFEVVTGLWTTPHAWGVVGDQVLTIGGPLTVEELKAAVDGLS